MIYGNGHYTLSTGKAFYANGGILGLGMDSELTEGYDGIVDTEFIGEFTEQERKEIAEEMIKRWQAWNGGKYVK